MKKRFKFAKKASKDFTSDVWTKQIAFYLDGVSFTHKTNPADEAKSPKGRIWRRANEGVDRGCTAKGSHKGYRGRLVKMMVAISHEGGRRFHLIKRQLNNEAIARNINKKSFAEFSARVKSTIVNFDKKQIDKIIESMSKHIEY
jgi:hypothetical protein